MSRGYLPFIDWMKAVGMILILYGHLAGWAPLVTLAPVYSKQFGVALFLFASGYSLARDVRPPWQIAFNRLFEMYLFGLACALIVAIVGLAIAGRPQLSNFLPFAAGVNVLFNNFPANPTTWYLGTYTHIIVLWALVARRIRVSPPVVAGAFVVEIVVRAVLIRTAGDFIAYMALTNWPTVFLLGVFYGQDAEFQGTLRPPSRGRSVPPAAVTLVLAVFVALWSQLPRLIDFTPTFPFMHDRLGTPFVAALIASSLASTVYACVTWLVFQAVRAVSAPAPIRFVARNTLIIFLAHMPLFYVMQPFVSGWGTSALFHSAVYLACCLVGLGLLSEAIRRAVRPNALRDRLWARLSWRLLEQPFQSSTT